MMNREEFNKTVKAMKAEGIALSMPNLMVRTELPRATIEDWLADLDNPPPRPTAQSGPGRRDRRPVADPSDDVASALLDRMTDLKNDLARTAATALVKEKLGIDDAVERSSDGALAPAKMKDLRWGAGLGFLFGPLGLFYAAPLTLAGVTSAIYVAAILLRLVPWGIGSIVSFFLMYLVPLAHIASALAGAAYTWRYNRTGKRSALLPEGASGGRRRGRDDDR